MTGSTTRRGLLAGVAATAAAPAAARAAGRAVPALKPAREQVVRRGRAIAADPRGRRLVVAHDQRRTIAIVESRGGATRIVDVGGQPVDVAVAPDGRRAAVTTASWDGPGLALVDLDAGRLLQRISVGPAPGAVAYAAAGRRLVVAGGEQEGTLHVLDAARGAVLAVRAIGPVPRGLAVHGQLAWVALQAADRLVAVGLPGGRVRRELRTPRLPDRLAVSPDGRALLVSHGGGRAEHLSEIATGSGRVRRHRAGELPSAVAWTSRGARLVTLAGAGEVLVLGAGGKRRRVGAGPAPRDLAVAGARAWTVDGLTGAIAQVRA
ncbi:MAG TPA: hypothetical protein VD931_04800 [Baekduia sp.]|nr:hypothetical protein [Baekduia sp.]